MSVTLSNDAVAAMSSGCRGRASSPARGYDEAGRLTRSQRQATCDGRRCAKHGGHAEAGRFAERGARDLDSRGAGTTSRKAARGRRHDRLAKMRGVRRPALRRARVQGGAPGTTTTGRPPAWGPPLAAWSQRQEWPGDARRRNRMVMGRFGMAATTHISRVVTVREVLQVATTPIQTYSGDLAGGVAFRSAASPSSRRIGHDLRRDSAYPLRGPQVFAEYQEATAVLPSFVVLRASPPPDGSVTSSSPPRCALRRNSTAILVAPLERGETAVVSGPDPYP